MPEQNSNAPEGVPWLNPNDLPGGVQVSYWAFDDDGPAELPVGLETPSTHTELTREDAARIGRALLGAAGLTTSAADARERLARHLYLQAHPDDTYADAHWQAGDSFVNKDPWRRKADAALAAINAKEH